MSTREQILAALTDNPGGLTCKELAPLCSACECDAQVVGRNIATLSSEGLLQSVGQRAGETIYVFEKLKAEPREAAARAIAAMRESKTQEQPMTPNPPLAERVVGALRKHGPCNLDQLAKHAGTTRATLYTRRRSALQRGARA